MESLHKSFSIILATITTVANAYVDKKFNWKEWFQIGVTVLAWVWIFKHLHDIQSDIQSGGNMDELSGKLAAEFDIPQDQVEEMIEKALGIILMILGMVGMKTVIPTPQEMEN
jgi:hypothetical protein